MNRPLFLSLFFASSFICSSGTYFVSSALNSNDSNIIHITYDAQEGFFDEAQKITQLTFPVRKGVKWGKRYAGEKPSNNPISSVPEFTFKTWQYINDDNVLVDINDNYQLNKSMTVYARYSNAASFENDTWANMIEIANKDNGLDLLKQTYSTDFARNGNTFVGLEKNITYANKDYKVRVIGEAADKIANDDYYTALTFEFVNTIDGVAYDSNKSNNYINSDVRKFLSGQFINNLPTEIANNIKPVTKSTYIGAGTGSGSVTTSEEKCFILSLSEMGFEKDLFGNPSENEGNRYAYYVSHNSDESRIKSYKSSDGSLVNSLYWLRSPYISQNDTAWCIDKTGHLGRLADATVKTYEPLEVEHGASISPVFSIGKTLLAPSSFENATWSDIIKNAAGGISTLISAYKDSYEKEEYFDTETKTMIKKPKNSFLGLTHNLQIGDANYTVKVIGQNHDYVDDPTKGLETAKKATLTFELSSIYGLGASEEAIVFESGSSSKQDYTQSTIATTMDKLLKALPAELVSGIKPVYKYSQVGTLDGGNYSYVSKPSQLKLFPLSASEYGIQTSLSFNYGFEGEPYEYYKYDTGVTDTTFEDDAPDLIRKRRARIDNDTITANLNDVANSSDGAFSYLRSIYTATTGDRSTKYVPGIYSASTVNNSGTSIDNGPGSLAKELPINNSSKKIGVSPAFCI